MGTPSVINVDLANVYEKQADGKLKFLHALAWGDEVEVLETTPEHVKVRTARFSKRPDGSILREDAEAFIVPKASSGVAPAQVVIPRADNRVLKVNFVDVQQGDGAVIESPDGKVILVDGGDNQLFARYLAARFGGTSAASPKVIDCILITHGDADHFAGLTEIHESEANPTAAKRLFIAPPRIYQNGLVKRPEKIDGVTVKEKDMLGATAVVDGTTVVTEVVDDMTAVPEAQMNQHFKAWKKAVTAWRERGPIEIRRLSFGSDTAFDFFNRPGLAVQVLGPIPFEQGGVTGLKFLGKPPEGPRVGHESLDTTAGGFTGLSAAHTINGHSIVFRLTYGGFGYLFCGDLNDEASRVLAVKHQAGEISLRSEVFKVPHHGSADFSGALLQRVSPVVSVVSSGDESARKEYIHPRATLLGALGKYSRVEEPLIFVTELVAFFEVEGYARLSDPARDARRGQFFAFSRAAYGIVKTRTDGKRLLVYTDSGKVDLKEAYAYELDANAVPTPSPVVRV